MSDVSPEGRKAIEQARQGDFDGALATATAAIGKRPDDAGLRFFAGMLHVRKSDFPKAAEQLREAVALEPRDGLARSELIRVLVALGQLDEAESLLGHPGVQNRDRQRLGAAVAARRGDHAAAIRSFREAVALDPQDFESWANLGISLLAVADSSGAASALEHALKLRPANLDFGKKWAEARAAAGTADEALDYLYRDRPDDPNALLIAARLEDLQERPERATENLERVLARDPGNAAALAMLADLYERANRLDSFESTVERLGQAAPEAAELPLLRARSAYRRGDLDAALKLAEQAPEDADPASRMQLLGQIRDRRGEPDAAFSAFAEMNRIDSLTSADPLAKAAAYLETLESRSQQLTRAWVESWAAAPEPPVREPAFLVGFPRSGTTLLDTLLMSAPEVAVSEENPLLTEVSRQIGSFEAIADLDAPEIVRLRDFYFAEAGRWVPDLGDRLLLDKFPFALNVAPLIERLFPGAPIIFLARHPCDVVLSCFMTRFQPTETGSAFLTLEGSARLYARTMELWTQSRALLPLRVHDIRYETLVDQPEAELRGVAEFLRISWSEELLDNAPTARRRGFIKTPSYSQVAEPIYRRAVERWRSYSAHFQPVMPILEPWIEQLGYEA